MVDLVLPPLALRNTAHAVRRGVIVPIIVEV